MTELGDSLARMSFMQLLLLFAFVTHYMLAVGGMLGTKGRLRAALLALVLAAGFTALTEPWVHGALLVAFVVAGLGLFVMIAWLLARLFSPRAVVVEAPAGANEPARDATTIAPPRVSRYGELPAPAVKLPQRAPVSR